MSFFLGALLLLNSTFFPKRQINYTFKICAVMAGKGALQFRAELSRRLSPINVYDASNSVATIKRALRASKHFYALDVEKIDYCA